MTWKPPARRQYRPKPLDPGQPITWAMTTSGYWTGETWGQGEWIPGTTVNRSGLIWSAGPLPSSVWVQADDVNETVCVMLPTPKRVERGEGPAELTSFGPEWQRMALRRANHVARLGQVYAVVNATREVYHHGYRRGTEQVLMWHCDADCPDAAGKPRSHHSGRYQVKDVIDTMICQGQDTGKDWCRRCIWLDAPEPASDAQGDAQATVNGPAQARIVQVVTDAARPLRGQEIADLAGVSFGTARVLLHKLTKRGVLTQPSRGLYTVPETTTEVAA